MGAGNFVAWGRGGCWGVWGGWRRRGRQQPGASRGFAWRGAAWRGVAWRGAAWGPVRSGPGCCWEWAPPASFRGVPPALVRAGLGGTGPRGASCRPPPKSSLVEVAPLVPLPRSPGRAPLCLFPPYSVLWLQPAPLVPLPTCAPLCLYPQTFRLYPTVPVPPSPLAVPALPGLQAFWLCPTPHGTCSPKSSGRALHRLFLPALWPCPTCTELVFLSLTPSHAKDEAWGWRPPCTGGCIRDFILEKCLLPPPQRRVVSGIKKWRLLFLQGQRLEAARGEVCLLCLR